MLEFVELGAENFLAIKAAKIPLTPGLTLFGGRNFDMSADGSEANATGKSSIWDALRWVLFDAIDRTGAKADSVVNNRVGKGTRAWVVFRQHGHTWTAIRYRKHDEHGDKLRLLRGDVEVTAHLKSETEGLLTQALAPLDAKIFQYAILVGQGMPHRFLSMTEGEKQNFLCKIAGVDAYDRALDAAKKAAAKSEAAASQAKALLDRTKEALARHTKARDDLRTKIAMHDDNVGTRRAQIEEEIVSLSSQLSSLSAQEAQVQVNLDATIAQHETSIATALAAAAQEVPEETERIKRAEMKLRSAGADADVYVATIRAEAEAQAAQARAEKETASEALKAVEARIKTTIAEYQEANAEHRRLLTEMGRMGAEVSLLAQEEKSLQGLGPVCITCRQKISDDHVHTQLMAIQAKLIGARDDLQSHRDVDNLTEAILKDREDTHRTLVLESNRLRDLVRTTEQNERNAGFKLTQLDETRKLTLSNAEATYQRELQAVEAERSRRRLAAEHHASKTRALIEAQKKDARRAADTLSVQRKSIEFHRTDLQKGIAALDTERAQLLGRVEEVEGNIRSVASTEVPRDEAAYAEAQKQDTHTQFWVKSIPQLRAAAISKIVSYLNEKAGEYLTFLSNGTMGLEIHQAAHGQGSKIVVSLRTEGGAYGMSSGGEQRRIDTAIYLAVSDLLRTLSGLACNLIVCDEVTDGLSPTGVRKFLELLEDRARNGWSVYVTSHNPAIRQSAHFDRSLYFVKRDGVSVIEES